MIRRSAPRADVEKLHGLELDTEVALALGWQLFPYITRDPDEDLYCPPGVPVHINVAQKPPSFSSDRLLGLDVAEQLEAEAVQQGCFVEMTLARRRGSPQEMRQYMVRVAGYEDEHAVVAAHEDSLPKAVCRAFLKWRRGSNV
jgi:hypothetical protein